MIEKNKNSIIVIVVLSTFFGLVSGIVGSITVKSYFGTSSAFWGDFDFVNGNLDKPNLIISGARKVVVSQDERIAENISLINNSLVGVYEKKATSTKKSEIDIDSFYVRGEELGAGLIISSDGWLVTDAISEEEFSKNNLSKNINKYVVINKNGDLYKIDKVVIDEATGFLFLHADVRDLPVLNIAMQNNLITGETVFSTDVSGNNFISTISSTKENKDYLSMSSDFYYDKISLVDDIGSNFNSSFIFNVSGEVIMFVNKKGDLIPTRVFNSAIKSLFEKGIITRPSLGLTYTDLSYLISGSKEKEILKTGSLVKSTPSKISLPWAEAGIEAGDIIQYVGGIKLDMENNLTKILMNYSPGDELNLGIIRGTEEMEIKVKLGEL